MKNHDKQICIDAPLDVQEVVIDLGFQWFWATTFKCNLTSTLEPNVNTEICLIFHYCVVKYRSIQDCDCA